MNEKTASPDYEQNELSAYMAINTESMGTIQMYMKLKENNISFHMTGEDEEITNYLRAQSHSFRKAIESIGFHVLKEQYETQKAENGVAQKKDIVNFANRKLSEDGFEFTV